MGSRLNLQRELLTLSNNVYFQPPANVNMRYPAIVYSINDMGNMHADDDVYGKNRSYTVTVIDSNPDSPLAESVSNISTCRFNRCYSANGLNHFVFTIYYNNNTD